MGDARSFEYVCALRAVTSSDGMTADSYGFDHAFLSHVATRIVNEVKGVNRVVYDVTSNHLAPLSGNKFIKIIYLFIEILFSDVQL